MLLYSQMRPHPFFRFGIAICPTAEVSSDYDWIGNQNPGAVWDSWNEDRLMAYLESLKKRRIELQQRTGDRQANLPPNFIIVDDCIGLINVQGGGGKDKDGNEKFSFNNFVSTARHVNCHLFFLNQYIAAARSVSTTLRNNTNFAMMWKQPMEKSIKALYEAYGGYYDSWKEFKQRLLNDRGREYSCLVYRSGYNDKEGSYLRLDAQKIPDDFEIAFTPSKNNEDAYDSD